MSEQKKKKPIIVAVANQKGGVGKSATTANVGYALAKMGKRVLIIDCDAQSSISQMTGFTAQTLIEWENAGRTLYHGMAKNVPFDQLVCAGAEGKVSVIGATVTLATVDQELSSPYGAAATMKKKIAEMQTPFDVILLDCPPSPGLMMVAALTAASKVIIPCHTELLSMLGMSQFLETVERVVENSNPTLEVLGVLPTIYNSQANQDRECLTTMPNVLPEGILIWPPIKRLTAFQKATVQRVPVWTFAPALEANYIQIAKAVLGDLT